MARGAHSLPVGLHSVTCGASCHGKGCPSMVTTGLPPMRSPRMIRLGGGAFLTGRSTVPRPHPSSSAISR